jgi:hypothetical protein
MALPIRRRGKLSSAAKTARNIALADAALSLLGSSSRRRGPSGKTLLIGGAAAVAVGAALWKRDKARALLPGGSSPTEPWSPPAPPQPSNYDAPGPPANTATPIPAPDPVVQPDPARSDPIDEPAVRGEELGEKSPPLDDPLGVGPTPADHDAAEPIDEVAEERAAAAEAAAIGGQPTEYAGTAADEPTTEAERPLAEAGEGVSEGQEQAEAELEENATVRDAGRSDAEAQLEDAIESAGDPHRGETVEPATPPKDAAAGDEDDGGGDWQTWSGGAVKPS